MKCASIALAVLLLTGCRKAPEPPVSFIGRLDLEVPALLEKHREAGLAVAFVEGCKSAIRTYGFANQESRSPVREDTVFNVGSVSKTLTAWTVMTLVEEGKVNLDDAVDTYMKTWHLPTNSDFRATDVTVGRLLKAILCRWGTPDSRMGPCARGTS